MNRYTEAQRAYLSQRRLARLATVGSDGIPHVVPVGMWSLATDGAIDVGGRDLAGTKKFRDVLATGHAAIVIDDLLSTDPWRPRGLEVRGSAVAIPGPPAVIRIHPDRVASWGHGLG